jgi:hypothetical protein
LGRGAQSNIRRSGVVSGTHTTRLSAHRPRPRELRHPDAALEPPRK